MELLVGKLETPKSRMAVGKWQGHMRKGCSPNSKFAMGMSLNIKPTEVVPVCNKAWQQSFARVEPNERAVSRRGWDPLNRGLLKHPDILKTKVAQAIAVPDSATVPTEAISVPDSVPQCAGT
jgi:hypothetical protein